MSDPASTPSTPPLLRVVRGDPTAEQVAALVAVLALTAAAGSHTRRARTPEWSAPRRLVRTPVGLGASPGPSGWRSSALPR